MDFQLQKNIQTQIMLLSRRISLLAYSLLCKLVENLRAGGDFR